jgi:pyruvate dehydrogenase E1 component alpha subunit
MGTSVERASAEPELYKRAHAYRMRGERVDGNDLEAVLAMSEELLANARRDREPAVLELLTYRYRGHSVADAGLAYRSKDEIAEHRADDDPIELLGRKLVERDMADEDALEEIRARVKEQIAEAVAFAEDSDEPDVDSLAEHVYGDPNYQEQFARMRPGSPFGETTLVFERGLAS